MKVNCVLLGFIYEITNGDTKRQPQQRHHTTYRTVALWLAQTVLQSLIVVGSQQTRQYVCINDVGALFVICQQLVDNIKFADSDVGIFIVV